MSQNPPEPENYYSPQAMATRLFQLDIQIENIKHILRMHIEQLKAVDVAVLDLQHQIRACAARHDEDKK